MLHRRLIPALFLGLTACGISIEASEPLLFVAPLEGDWTLETDPNTEFRVTIPGGQPRFRAQFDFTVDLVTPGGTTTYDGTADEETFDLRDNSGSIVLSGEFVENTMIRLTDGRRFTKAFDPDFIGVWRDVNAVGRFYVIDAQNSLSAIPNATGCADAADVSSAKGEIQGTVRIEYSGDQISSWKVESASALLRVDSAAFFVGHSAIRVKRIDGYMHLQRAVSTASCP